MSIRLGASIFPQHAEWPIIRDAIVAAEDGGVDIVFTWDHFFPLWGDTDGQHFECWTILAAMAEITDSVEIGPLVSANSYRNPNLLADMARTIDHISGGRLIFGIGSGWFQRDYDEYGYEFGTAAGRLADLDQNLPLITDRFSKLNPPPTRKIPIMIGGGGEKVTLRITAEHADIWHGFSDTFARKNGILDEWCERVGRDPGAIERSCGIRDPKDLSLAQAAVDAGAEMITVGLRGPDYDMGLLAEWVAFRDDCNRKSNHSHDVS